MPSTSAWPSAEPSGGGRLPDRPLLTARGLAKSYTARGLPFASARVHALDGVSLDLFRGETLAIVGESGCGKSTLASLLTRLAMPDAGEVRLAGAAPGARARAHGQRVQMVFQNSGGSLNPRATLRDIVAFGPRAAGVGPAERNARAEALLEAVGLPPALFAARYPHELSGGQRQRVNIARALAVEPEIVVLDEPVSALDKSVEAQILNLLVTLRARLKLSLLVITHDLAVAHYLADRVATMYLGQIVEEGGAEAVFAAPRHPYTRALLASRPGGGAPLEGDPPSPVNRPSGCRFHPRCSLVEEVCRIREPVLRPVAGGIAAACHAHDPASGHSGRGA